MKNLILILSMSMSLIAYAGGDYIITKEGEKIEVLRMRVKKHNFQVRLKDRTTKVFSNKDVLSYYDSENDEYFEKLDLKEKTLFLKVILTDGESKIVSHNQTVEYAGGIVSFEELYFYKDDQCIGKFNRENHMRILKNEFRVCTSFRKYVHTKRSWFRRLEKLNKYLRSQCQGAS